MNSILNNPYRILGLLANASAREINTRVNRLRMYIEAEEEMPENDDFGFSKAMGKPERSKASVDKARSGLNMDEDRVSNALFWFWKDNDISDETAFDALKDQDADTAIGIWQRLTDRGEVTERNSSAFLNLSTLLLYLSMNEKTVKKEYFEKGLRLKIQFLESRFSDEFVKKVGDETCKKDTIKLELWLLNQILDNLGKVKGLTPIEMTEMLSGWTFAAKDKFLKEFSSALAKDINDKVKICSGKRDKTPEKANELGDELYKSVSEDLLQLEKMLGESNMTYGDTADAVAGEILQCSIDFYNKNDDSGSLEFGKLFGQLKIIIDKTYQKTIDGAKNMLAEANPILRKMKTDISSGKKSNSPVKKRDTALKLLEKARSIAVGHAIRERCEENRKIMSENEEPDLNTLYQNLSTRIADNAMALILEEIKNSSGMTQQRREKVKQILDEILLMDLTPEYRKTIEDIKGQMTGGDGNSQVKRAIDELLKLRNESKTITPAEAEPYLLVIKNVLGNSDDNYVQISSAIANKILGDHITAVNEELKYISVNAYDKISALKTLKYKIDSAMSDMNRLESWDLTSDFRSRLKTNKSTFSDLSYQLRNIDNSSSNYGGGYTPVRKNKSGCYIATMAYGDYNHPQVLELRRFRDDVLAQSIAGRLFIQTYYCVSPKLVELLKGHEAINSFIRNILNQFIKIIKIK